MHVRATLDKFLGLKEALEMPHLPDAHENEDDRLAQRPPQHPCIRTVTHLPKPLLPLLCVCVCVCVCGVCE